MKPLLLLMFSLLIASSVLASGPSLDSDQSDDTFFLGLKGGRMLVAFDDTSGAASPGFVVGYQLNDRFSLEGSFIKGSPVYETGAPQLIDPNSTADNNIDYSNYTHDKLNANMFGLHLSYRSQRKWYFLAKGGIAHADMESNEFVPGISSTAFSGSLGGGWRVGKQTLLEAEIMHIDKNMTYIGVTGIMLGF